MSQSVDLNSRAFGPGPRSRVKRHPERARYDAPAVHALIDEALLCHVAVVVEGEPLCLPTAHARIDDVVYLHGALKNRLLQSATSEARCCLSFTLIDGLVLARSAFHHSMNFRSAVVFGPARVVSDAAEKQAALSALIDHALPGRSAETRPPTDEELAITAVVRVDIEEASVKVRAGGAVDSPADLESSRAWAGVVPLAVAAGSVERDVLLPFDVLAPATIKHYSNSFEMQAVREELQAPFLLSTDKSRLDVGLIHRFLRDDSYWAKGTSLERTQRVIDGSLCFGLYEGQAQIGNARVVSDGGRFAYLADVFVLPEYRGLGLGTRFLRFVLDDPALADVSRIVLGTADAHPFYARCGFERAPDGRYMVRLGPEP